MERLSEKLIVNCLILSLLLAFPEAGFAQSGSVLPPRRGARQL